MDSPSVMPNAIYSYPSTQVSLRIGTGGSGQSGLLQALAEAFIKFYSTEKKVPTFCIEWYTSDTSRTIEYLHKQIVDVGITYHAVAEHTALEDGVIDRVEYVFRDHWMLVGPKANPAKLPTNKRATIYTLFTKLFDAMEDSEGSSTPIKFLSRYDKSACNIVESTIWSTIGETPWAEPPSTWYHMLNDFPFQAIRKAAELGEYTLTDRGTWCAIESDVRDKLIVFAEGKNDEKDPLLNPAHLLVGTKAKNKAMANSFADWVIRSDGGQEVIKTFKKNGLILYDTAPTGVDPLAKAKGILGVPGPVRASAPLSTSPNEMYFFKDDMYVRIDAVRDTISYTNAKKTWDKWPGLKALSFATIDAVIAVPDSPSDAYFFSDYLCASVNMASGSLSAEGVPFDFTKKWTTLKEAGFETIDVILPWIFGDHGHNSHAYFFHNEDCICIDLKTDKVVHPKERIATKFQSLTQAGFADIDTAILKPGKEGKEAYFFSGTQYVLVDLERDQVYYGPLEVANSWKSLNAAGFY